MEKTHDMMGSIRVKKGYSCEQVHSAWNKELLLEQGRQGPAVSEVR